MKKKIDILHENVPGDYYDHAIKHNVFQTFWHKQRFKEIAKAVSGKKYKRMLDIGCHGGTFTHEIAKRIPNTLVYGIDVSSRAIAYAKKKYPQFHLKVGKGEHVPYKKNTFDLVTCLEVLEHVEDPRVVLNEIKRVLVRNGHFIVLVPSENLLFRVIWFFWTRLGPGRVWHHTHLQKFTNQSLEHLLERIGFEVIFRKKFILGMLLLIDARKKERQR